MKIAAIDIGTNTVLMTIKNLSEENSVKDFSSIVRLGEGLHDSGIISQAAIDRLIETLKNYKSILDSEQVEKTELIATSAMRDAKNRSEVIEQVFSAVGMTIEVISGDEEASLTYFGGLDGLKFHSNSIGLLDIGGGSTEYIIGSGSSIKFKKSLNIGTVRLSERFGLLGENPNDYQITKFTDHVYKQLHSLPFYSKPETEWVAVAGTPTSLSSVILNLTKYIPEMVHGSIITKSQLKNYTKEFSSVPPSEIVRRYPILNKRQDLILAGCLILLCSFEHFSMNKILVSDRGLRSGKLKKMARSN